MRHARPHAGSQRTCTDLLQQALRRCRRRRCCLAGTALLPLAAQGAVLLVSAFWLFFCTYMFHGVLEGQLSLSDSAEVRQVAPTERECGGWARSWCEQRVAQHRADAVRRGMQHAWAGYKAYAWGADEIHPKSKTAKTDIMVGWRQQPPGCGDSCPAAARPGAARAMSAPVACAPTGRRGRVRHGRQHCGRAVHAEGHGPGRRV